MDDPKQDTASVPDELEAEYANNVMFEATIWDLKLIFGEFSQLLRNGNVEWHTSITMPWAQAKLLAYYLTANVIAHEIRVGTIQIPAPVVPPEWPTPDPTDAVAVEIHKRLQDLHSRFMAEMQIPKKV
jgi:hypothetical protein